MANAVPITVTGAREPSWRALKVEIDMAMDETIYHRAEIRGTVKLICMYYYKIKSCADLTLESDWKTGPCLCGLTSIKERQSVH